MGAQLSHANTISQAVAVKIKQAMLQRFTSSEAGAATAREAQRLAEQQEDVLGAAWAMLILARCELAHKDPETAEAIYECLMLCFERWADRRGYLHALFSLARRRAQRGELAQAWELVAPCLHEVDQESDPLCRGYLHSVLAHLCQIRDQAEEALFFAFRAAQDSKELQEPAPLCISLNNLGATLYEADCAEQALIYLSDALRLARQHQLASVISMLTANLSECLRRLDRTEEAVKLLAPLMQSSPQLLRAGLKGYIYSTAACSFAASSDWLQAEAALVLAAKDLGAAPHLDILYLLACSTVASAQGDLEKARMQLVYAEQELPKMGEEGWRLSLKIYNRLAQIYEQQAQFELASQYYRRHSEVMSARHMLANRARHAAVQFRLKLRQLEQARASERLRIAQTDGLTNLLNREALRQRGERLLAHGNKLLVVMFSLNHYKTLNEALGADAADGALQALALRLRQVFGDKVGRMHGEKFCLLAGDAEQLPFIQQLFADLCAQPLLVQDQALDLALSYGYSSGSAPQDNMQQLMRNAEIALRADVHSHQGWTAYDQQMEGARVHDLGFLAELRHATENNELCLFLQPKVGLSDGVVRSAEVLVRWRRENQEMVPPGDFIPFAEQTGALNPLTRWVLRAVLRLSARWREQGRALPLSVNLSPHDLGDPHFAPMLQALFNETQANPADICLELTESGTGEGLVVNLPLLQQLKQMGLQLLIDDFGSSHASIANLHQMPVSELKIDAAFVHGVKSGSDAATLLKGTIELGHSLGLQVTAKGVETEEEWQLLKQLRCDYAQGWYAAKAMNEEDFLAWYAQRG